MTLLIVFRAYWYIEKNLFICKGNFLISHYFYKDICLDIRRDCLVIRRSCFLILKMVHKPRPLYSALSLSYLSVFCFTNMHVSPTSFRLYFISNFTNPIILSFMDENFREECWYYRRLKVWLFTCSHGAESLKSQEKHFVTSTWRKNTIHAIWHIFLCCKKCISGVPFYYYQHKSIFRLIVYNICEITIKSFCRSSLSTLRCKLCIINLSWL